MIALLAAAGLLMQVQWGLHGSNVPIEDLAVEVETTGAIRCPLSAEEKELGAKTMAQVLKTTNYDNFVHRPLVWGCAVLRVQVMPDGRPGQIDVIRMKGGDNFILLALTTLFKPSDHEWIGLIEVNGAVLSPTDRAEYAAFLRKVAATVAKSEASRAARAED